MLTHLAQFVSLVFLTAIESAAPTLPDRICDARRTPVSAAETSWGKTVRGLKVGLRNIDAHESYRLGEQIRFEVLVSNGGRRDITLSYVDARVADARTGEPVAGQFYELPLTVTDQAGSPVHVSTGAVRSGRVPTREVTLAPGATAAVGETTLTLHQPGDRSRVTEPTLFARAGFYVVHQVFTFQRKTGVNESVPSGPLDLQVTADKAANDGDAVGREGTARRQAAAGAPQQPPPKSETFRGLDLRRAPMTTDVTTLNEIFEVRPPNTSSYEVRKDVVALREPGFLSAGEVYYLPAKQRFYVQVDPVGSSQHHFYGPFPGDPRQLLDLGTGQAPLSSEERLAIVAAAYQAIRTFLPGKHKGNEIPRELWGEAIVKLGPLRVTNDRVNVKIVLKDDHSAERGLYVSIPISSYAPGVDGRFTTFDKLSEPGDNSFGGLYRYSIRRTKAFKPTATGS